MYRILISTNMVTLELADTNQNGELPKLHGQYCHDTADPLINSIREWP